MQASSLNRAVPYLYSYYVASQVTFTSRFIETITRGELLRKDPHLDLEGQFSSSDLRSSLCHVKTK